MMTNIIELYQNYKLGVTDVGYVVYQLQKDSSDINAKRNKATYCKTFDGVLEFLIRCELQNENVTTLQDMQKVLNAIRAEVSSAIRISQSELY